METIDCRTWKEKVAAAKNSVKKGLVAGYEWCKENPKEAFAIGASVVGVGLKVKVDRDARKAQCDFWDPASQTHMYTKRPLNRAETAELQYRVHNGETRYEALSNMNLLK